MQFSSLVLFETVPELVLGITAKRNLKQTLLLSTFRMLCFGVQCTFGNYMPLVLNKTIDTNSLVPDQDAFFRSDYIADMPR